MDKGKGAAIYSGDAKDVEKRDLEDAEGLLWCTHAKQALAA